MTPTISISDTKRREIVCISLREGKTVILNLSHIAKDLNMRQEFLARFLETRLRCKCVVSKVCYTDRCFSFDQLEGCFSEFIETFVRCQECKECVTRLTKSRLECICGASREVITDQETRYALDHGCKVINPEIGD